MHEYAVDYCIYKLHGTNCKCVKLRGIVENFICFAENERDLEAKKVKPYSVTI